jgi:DNA-binding response OmpR family regulator
VNQRILVVEDDESIGQTVSTSLQSHGYLVQWCTDGASATAAVEQTVPDLVLLDAGLPDVDGFTLCRWFREQHRDLPIVLVTARGRLILTRPEPTTFSLVLLDPDENHDT